VLALAVWLACRTLADAAAAEATPPRVRDLLRRTPLAFAVGDASHPVGDGLGSLLAGRYDQLSSLLYPFVPAPVSPNDVVAPWVRLCQIYVVGGTVATRRARGIVLVTLVVFVAAHA
jgi:hypothetical protein